MRFARRLRRIVFESSRHGRAAEIVGWSNAAAAAAVAIGLGFRMRAPWVGVLAFAVGFIGLRLLLSHRKTVAFAAMLGTLAIGSAAGVLTWLFAHVVDSTRFANALAVVGALVGGAVSSWAYAEVASKRHENIRDSLIVSTVPSSPER